MLKAVIATLVVLACTTVSACSDAPGALPSGSVALSTAMSSVALTQDDSASIDVTIKRDAGFSGPVGLAVSGAPAGVTVGVPATPVTGSGATLSLSVHGAAVPGVYTLSVTPTGAIISPQTLSLDLQVAPRAPQSIAVRYCSGLQPSWVAFEDGNGAWMPVAPTAVGDTITFRSDFSTDRGAMATVFHFLEFTSLVVQYGTPAELANLGDAGTPECGPRETKTLLGSVAGVGTNEAATISTGAGVRVRTVPEQGGFVLNAVPVGPQDFLATLSAPANGGEAISRMIVRRNVNAADGATLPVFDFAAPEAFAPAVANVSVTGLGPEGALGSTGLLTSNDELPVTVVTSQGTDVTHQYVALPEAQLLPGDLQVLFVTQSPAASAAGRTATLYFRAPIDRTLTLGAALTPPTFVTVATEPALRLRAQFVPQGDYDRSAGVALQQNPGTVVSVNMTAAYADRAGRGYDIPVPDLSRAAGFDPAWALHVGGDLLWAAGRIGGTLGFGPNAVPSDGATRRTASAAGTTTAQSCHENPNPRSIRVVGSRAGPGAAACCQNMDRRG
jgi:hypothetical protein